MLFIATDLFSIITKYEVEFQKIDENIFAYKPAPEKWSNKEIIGHLIDSAQNNLRRFIVGQLHEHTKIVYDQDFWVTVNNYQDTEKTPLIQLWSLINKRIVSVLQQMPEHNYLHVVDTGKEKVEERTLLWLAEDYVKHLQHHINQIIPGSFDVVY